MNLSSSKIPGSSAYPTSPYPCFPLPGAGQGAHGCIQGYKVRMVRHTGCGAFGWLPKLLQPYVSHLENGHETPYSTKSF